MSSRILFDSDGAGRSRVLGMVDVSGEKNTHSLQLEQQITELFNQLSKPVYRYGLSLGLPASAADEITQETFLRLFQHLARKGREDNLRGWIFRVAHNLAMDFITANRHFADGSIDDWPLLLDSLQSRSLGPEEALLEKERMRRVHDAMKLLSSQQRECLALRSEGFRYREIAEIMEISVHTVAEHLQRAMQKLSRELSESI